MAEYRRQRLIRRGDAALREIDDLLTELRAVARELRDETTAETAADGGGTRVDSG